jgi:hypothetical protein
MENKMRKPVVRIVVVLSVLTLVGVVALAAGGHHGIVTSQDGRLSMTQRGSNHVTAGEPSVAGLTLIAGNLSKYPYGVYFCCYGYTISGPESFLGTAYWAAVPFTPTTNMSVRALEASVGWGSSGTEGVTLSLNSDANGVPGGALASADLTNLGDFGDCCVLAVAKDPAGVPVVAGTQYWLVVSTSATFANTFDAWAFNSTDMREDYAVAFYNSSSGAWSASEGLLPGYAVYGQ